MSTQATPYISLASNAREAMEFYADVFGGQLELIPVHDDPTRVMHSHLVTDAGWHLMASDITDGAATTVAGNVTICIWGDDIAAAQQWFATMAEGGTIHIPFEPQPWGDHYGNLIDRFGVSWGFNFQPPQE